MLDRDMWPDLKAITKIAQRTSVAVRLGRDTLGIDTGSRDGGLQVAPLFCANVGTKALLEIRHQGTQVLIGSVEAAQIVVEVSEHARKHQPEPERFVHSIAQ